MEERLVLVLWRTRDLLGRALRERLAAAGCTTVQVNVSDEAVAAAALRLSTFPEPVEAVLTLTGDPDPAGVARSLDEVCSHWAGWRVESAEPIPPREVPDGERLDALANVALLRRPAEQPADEWLAVWRGDHTAVAIETQATFGYVQHRVLAPLTPDTPDVAAVVEEHFPMAAMTDPHAFYGSGGDPAELDRRLGRMLASVARFGADRDLDVVPTSRYRWRVGP